MSRNWLDPGVETGLLDEVAMRRQRLSAGVRALQPQHAVLANSWADAYPWMEAGAVSSLVQAGIPADSPQALSIADLAAQQAAEEGGFNDAADDVPDAWYETLWNATTGWAKPIVRTGFTILSAPFEELQALLSSAGTALLDETEAGEQGLFSDLGGNLGAVAGELFNPGKLVSDFWQNYTSKAARSSGLLALGDLVQGKEVSLGEGFLPGGDIFQEREEAKWRLTLDGHFVTPGRLISRQFSEPGSWQWNMLSGLNDAAQNLFIDPSAALTGGLSKAQKANRAFQTVGAIAGVRKTVSPERAVNHYLTSDVGQRLVGWLTDTDDIETIWQAIGRTDLDTAGRLARAHTTDETFGILSDTLGTVIREKPTAGFASRTLAGLGGNEYGALFGGGARARRSLANVRVGLDMPRSVINPHDINDAAVQLDRWIRNAKLSDDVRKTAINRLAALPDGDSIGLFEVTKSVMSDTAGVLVSEAGIELSRARDLTRMYENLGDELRAFGFDALGRHEDVLGPFRLNVDGNAVVLPKAAPLLASEMIDDVIPLPPTARDIRRLRPEIDRMRRLFDSGLWKGGVDGIDHAMSTIWKPFQLLRGAYTVRVIGEEQLRMAGAGYDSMISNPASAIAWALSVDPSSTLGRRFANTARKVIGPKGTQNVLGEAWDEVAEHAAAMSRGAAGHNGLPGELLTGRFVKANRDDPDFYRGWAVELAHQANDPIMRRLAGGLGDGDVRSISSRVTGNVVEDVKEWFWSGTGQKFRNDYARMEGRGALASSREKADEYIEIFVARLDNYTAGNTDILEAIKSGRLGELNLRGFGSERKIARLLETSYADAAPNYTKKAEVIRSRMRVSGLNRVVDMGFDTLMSKPTNWLSRSPEFRQLYWQRVSEVIGFADEATQHALIRSAREAGLKSGDAAFDAMLTTAARGGAGSRITTRAAVGVDDLSRSDEFFFHKTTSDRVSGITQSGLREGGFWSKLEDARRYRDPDQPIIVFRRSEFPADLKRREIIGRVTDRKLLDEYTHPDVDPNDLATAGDFVDIPRPVAIIEGDQVRWLDGFGQATDGLADIDVLAKGFALSETKRLLYDLQKRSQFFDMMSVVFPFGEAWKEIIGSWTRILRKNPVALRRFQQTLEGARAPSLLPGASPENEPGGGEGFFHPDPVTGEEVFTYPASWAAKLLGLRDENGAGVSFTGSAAGLNIVSATVLPGFGPVIQLPASKLIPDTPRFDDLRNILLPFGETEGIVAALTPAWFEKLQTAFEDPESHRLFANTVADVQRHLLQSGDYDLASAESQQKLYDDAVSKARVLYLVRGLAQSAAPTGPSLSWTTSDAVGNVVPVKLLSDDLRRLTAEKYGGDRRAAFGEWVKLYGVENVLSVIGKSQALVERPITEKGDDWLRANAELERDYALTIGYFAPEPAVGEFDYTAYLRQFETGAREMSTPSEQLALANDFLGRIQWENAKKLASLRPGPQTSVWLAQIREQIAVEYPGFEGWVAERVRAQRPAIDVQIAELRNAVTNDTLARTDTGQGTIKYLSALEAASKMVTLLPGNVLHYQEAKAARPVRDFLRSVAREIIAEHPDFARVWTQVFERELADDDPEVFAP